jgi:hypothetical protein
MQIAGGAAGQSAAEEQEARKAQQAAIVANKMNVSVDLAAK